jgi:hypothetical protein
VAVARADVTYPRMTPLTSADPLRLYMSMAPPLPIGTVTRLVAARPFSQLRLLASDRVVPAGYTDA